MSVDKTEMELTLFYGQSWISGIGPNRRRIVGERYPETAMMFDDGCGVKGWCGKPAEHGMTGYIPAKELERRTQSVQIPYLFRRAKRATHQNHAKFVAARSEGAPGASLRRLSENSSSSSNSRFGFDNLIAAIKAHVTASKAQGLKPTVPYVVWCQGAGDGQTSYDRYKKNLIILFDRISEIILQETGQDNPTTFLLLQPPGRSWGGNWPCLQVFVDLGFERSDCVLATAGWAFEQYDRVHFSGKGAVIAGELLHLVALGLEKDRWVSAPFLMNYQRNGNEITAQVGGPHDILIDETVQTPRHYVGDAPVPNHGFSAYGAEILNVEVQSRRIKITLDRADDPVTVGYAWHTGGDRYKAAGTEKNQSANRGTIRADWSGKSQYLDAPLYQWLASGYHSFD